VAKGANIKLTAKQDKFVQKYLECGNASEAYRCAYDADRMKAETIHRKAHAVLVDGKVTARLEKLRAKINTRAEVGLTEVANILSDVVMADVTEFINPNGTIKVDAISRMPIEMRRLIQSIKSTRNGVEIQLMDKAAAIDRLLKLRGWGAPVDLPPQRLIITYGDE
jgi:phage terminase small subunit